MILLPKIIKMLFHTICQTIQNCVILFHFPNYSVPAVHNPQDRPEIHYQRTARGEQNVSAWSFETSDLLRQHNVLMKILRPFTTKLTFLFSQAILSTTPNGTKHTAVCCEIHIKTRHFKHVHNNSHVNVISKVSSLSQSLSQSYWNLEKGTKPIARWDQYS